MHTTIVARLLCEEFGTEQKLMLPKGSWLLAATPTPAHGDVNLHFVVKKSLADGEYSNPDDIETRKFLVIRSDSDGFEADLADLMYIDTVVHHTHTLYVFEIDEEIGSWL
jgi:hypothetical protein